MRRAYGQGVVMVTAIVTLLHGYTTTAERSAGQTPPPKIVEGRFKLASVEGKDTYTGYCAVCHGMDGKGKGPAAPALTKPVPDLTQLAKQQGGKFSQLPIENTILGKGRVPASHGTVDMPIWGPIFHASDVDPSVSTLRIRNLVSYLESLQQK